MQIIIPMSGFGERYRRAGYKIPKPLIIVEGKPIIAHVIGMFPDENDFIFICNSDHLDNPKFKMKNILNKYAPGCKIVSVRPHKLGPVHAVLKAENFINQDSGVIVNYCDFCCYWNWKKYKHDISKNLCFGSIPAYKGFHPHSLGNTNYAYMLEKNGNVIDIQEKKPFTSDKMNEYASSGTYYFSSGKLMLDSFKYLIDEGLDLNGEYYVSLAYKYLLKNNLKVSIFPIQHFMQWGTPEDLSEYNYWSELFREIIKPRIPSKISSGNLVIPMAGLGKRFFDEGYKTTKPLIEVSGKPMVIQAINDLNYGKLNKSFVVRNDMFDLKDLKKELIKSFPKSKIKNLMSTTEGQAITALIGMRNLIDNKNKKIKGHVTFGACDNGVIYDADKLNSYLNDKTIDIIIWGVRGYYNSVRFPNMYGWIKEKDGNIEKISVKKPLKSPEDDPIIIGTFTFKNANDYSECVNKLIDDNDKVNGEYYIDSCINKAIEMGLKCKLFEVDYYLCWGTPNDLKTFEYWQSCFHKWDSHPYNLHVDSRVDEDKVDKLELKYKIFNQ